MIVVLMGVSGSGKTFIGELLAKRMGATFADGDDFHSAANKAKMAAGNALDDADRQPWLETLHGVIRSWIATGVSGVLACSALKESYRETLVEATPDGAVRLCLLEVPKEVLAARLAERHHEFMNPKLLESQLQTLEEPRDAIIVQNDHDADTVVDEIVAAVSSSR